ncbi:CMD domain protein [Allostreptomyces psammosilenae]|uniref:CMD domain protein n=1 Tax=Allostreptomyces psammosilenae TaxID=1892865 RepID=A0A852ZYC1_9ACTN|nr:CMD domain protein [Allostreptomyces psammosilenae]NYI07336.1 CMD domain protein [Allostreptomyces psammosilenae]
MSQPTPDSTSRVTDVTPATEVTDVTDVIDHLVGIAPGSRLDQVRRRRPDARENAQASYAALFPAPDAASGVTGEVTPAERLAVAAFVAGLHGDAAVTGFYADRLAALSPALATAVATEVERGRTTGPYGVYPGEGPLAAESSRGLQYRAGDRDALGERLAAALTHAHLLVFRPREASRAALATLLDAGWSTTGVVTLSQLVAFLSFQVRVVTGLRLLAAA